MIEAEKWYEYERDYQRYGIDMKPERVKPVKRRKRLVINPDARNKAETAKLAFSAVGILGLLAVISIVITAFCAGLQYDINQTVKDNAVLQGEIENLQAELYTAGNIEKVESTATGALGMKYASEKKRVYVYSDDVPSEGFYALIREKAYN